jgi:hypothetical protein
MSHKLPIKLHPNEQILEIVHEDIVPSLPWWIFLFVWIVAPFFFLFPLFKQGPAGIIFLAVLVCSGVFVAARSQRSRAGTMTVVTDQRVVDIVQRGFSDRAITEVNHEDVVEVSYRVKGLFPTIFRFGTVIIRTAGERADVAVLRVHRPIDLHNLLNDLRREAEVDPLVVSRAQKLKTLAEKMSDVEVDRLVTAVKNRETTKAAGEFLT